MAAPATPVRSFLIEVGYPRIAKNGDYINNDFEATAFTENVNHCWLIDLVLRLNNQSALFRATLIVQAFLILVLLYFTLLYFMLDVMGKN